MVRPADELLDELLEQSTRRAELIARRRRLDRRLAALFEEVREHPDLTLRAAATHAGITRSLAYKLMAQSGRLDDDEGQLGSL